MDNITLLEFSQLEDDLMYDTVLKHVEPSNLFLGVEANIMNMSYTNVRYCFNLIRNISNWENVKELFDLCYNLKDDDFFNAKVVDYYKAKRYLINQFKLIIDNEKKLSQGGNVDEGKWSSAGGDRLKPYNDVIGLDQLAQRYSIYPFDLGRKPYSEVFYLMAMVTTSNEVNYNYNKQ